MKGQNGLIYSLRSNPQKLTGIMFITICLAGLLYQITDVSNLYFGYFTRSEILITIPFAITPPLISLCFQYQDVMDFDLVSSDPKFTNHTFKRPFDPISNESIYFESYFTVADIFDLTPNSFQFFGESDKFLSPNGSIASYSCIYREPGSFVANHFTKIECQSKFQIEKYIQRHFMCYLLKVPQDFSRTYDITHTSLSKEWFGLIYRFILDNKAFKHVTYFTTFVHEHRSDKLFDSTLSNALIRGFSAHNISSGEDVKVTYYSSTIYKLPAPYDTNCYNVSQMYNTSYQSGTGLILECVNNYIKKNISHVSPIGQIFHKYTALKLARLSSDYDAIIFDEALKHCQISVSTCNLTSISTKTSLLPHKNFAVSLFWPQDTINQITYKPRMETVEYLLFLASCVGFWFGFSLYSFLFQTNNMIRSSKLPFVIETPCCNTNSGQGGKDISKEEFLRRKDLDNVVANILIKIQFDLFRQLNERNRDVFRIVLDTIERKERNCNRYSNTVPMFPPIIKQQSKVKTKLIDNQT